MGAVARQLVLGLALEFRIADEDADQRARAGKDVVGGDQPGPLFVLQVRKGLEPAQQRRAKAALVGAALGGGDGVAVRADKPVRLPKAGLGPADRPLDNALVVLALDAAREHRAGDLCALAELFGQVIGQPVGEMKDRLGRNLPARRQQIGGTAPADFHPAIQIRLRAGHAEDARRAHAGLGSENLGVGAEGHHGSAAVRHRAALFERAQRNPARKALGEQAPAARDLDVQPFRERIDHRRAHPVQPAGGLIGALAELAAGMQGGEDHLERRLVRKARMRVGGDAAPIVGDPGRAIRLQHDLDALGVTGDGLVHRIVQDLGEQMVQRALIGAADIHARPAAHRLEPLEHLDRMRAIVGARFGGLDTLGSGGLRHGRLSSDEKVGRT